MQIEVVHRPVHAVARVDLANGDAIRAESGAMVAMHGPLQVSTDGPGAAKGGLLGGLKRAVLGAESFFTNTFKATGDGAQVVLAPALCGDMTVHEVDSTSELVIQAGSFVAAPATVAIDTRFEGLKGLFSGEGLFFLRASGYGPVLINAFGAIDAIDLDGEIIVDGGHVVAFTSGIGYQVQKAASGWITSLLSGEGLVMRMQGRGRLYLQTRNRDEYGRAVGPLLKPRKG